MFDALFRNVTDSEKNNAIEAMIQHATPRQDFFLMMTLAVAMAVFGVILQSIIIVIGSMLIAPMLYPLLSLSLGIITSDESLIGRSIYTIGKSVALALIAGFSIGFLFGPPGVTPELSMTSHAASPLLFALVAAIAGFAAAFATTKPHLNETLPGVAIAVALVPPLAVAGIALAYLDWAVFTNAILLFLINVIGILFSVMIVFSLMRFSVKKKVTQEVVKEEAKVIEKEMKTTDEKRTV